MSALVRRAPRPRKTTKPEPLILAPRCRSMMPSASPMSQCGRTPSDARGSPHERTIAFASSPPSGTSGSVVLGISSRMARSSSSVPANSPSSRWISAPSSRPEAMMSVASSPAFFRRETSCEFALRAALRSSTAWIMARRSTSSAAPRSIVGASVSSFCRRRIALRNASTSSRNTRMSSMIGQFLGTPSAKERKPQLGSSTCATAMAREVTLVASTLNLA